MIKRRREPSSAESESYPDSEAAEAASFGGTQVAPRGAYKHDFLLLSKHHPILKKHMVLNLRWKPFMPKTAMYHFDFSHPDAVYHLSKAILKHSHGLELYMPCGCEEEEGCNADKELELYNQCLREARGGADFARFLAPCVPNRLSYIRAAASLLTPQSNEHASREAIGERLVWEEPPRGRHVLVLDVGTGASCIYALLGAAEHSWSFIGSEVDPLALELARKNVELNGMGDRIALRAQQVPALMFSHVLHSHEFVALTLCNPPFHSSLESTNLNPRTACTGRESELVFALPRNSTQLIEQSYLDLGREGGARSVEGIVKWVASEPEQGELAFIEIMLLESRFYCHNVLWFTSLVAKLSTLKRLRRLIQREMRQYALSHANQEQFLDAKLDRLQYQDLGFRFAESGARIEASHVHICEFRTFTLKLAKQMRWAVAWTYYNSQQRTRIINNLSSIAA